MKGSPHSAGVSTVRRIAAKVRRDVLSLGIPLILVFLSVAWAQASSVGFQKVSIPNGNEAPLQAAIWYPTAAAARDERLEAFVQRVASDAPVAGSGHPLVVISHGGGGTLAGHYDTAVALARAGFVVAAINHAGDTHGDEGRVLELWRRPAQLSRLITYVLEDWRGRSGVDSRRIGAFGFSNGGFTVLVSGGRPDLTRIDGYCRANPSHDLCTALRSAGITSISNGVVAIVGLVGGLSATIKLAEVFQRNLRLEGIETGSRKMLEDMIAWFEEKHITPVIDRVFPVEESRDAFRHLQSGSHFGKVCIKF